MKTLFIVNPTANRGKNYSKWTSIEQQLRQTGCFPFEVHVTAGPGEANLVSREATRLGFKRIIVVGGDGTVNEVINGIVGENIVIGIIPFGTGNDFARALNTTKSDKQLLHTLSHPKDVISVNVAQINGRYFLNAAGVGFDGFVASDINRHPYMKKLGAFGYGLSALKVLHSFVPFEARVTVDGTQVQVSETWLIAIGNTPRYGGGMRICPSAQFDDDLLDLCVASNLSKLDFVKLLPLVYSGKHVNKQSYITTLCGRHIEIQCAGEMMAHADGERITASSLRISLAEARIRIMRL